MERCELGVHFIKKDSERPPIDGLRVTVFAQDFGGHVVWSTTHRMGELPFPEKLLTQPEVCQLHVSFTAQQYVLWLQVSVDDTLRVQVLESNHDFTRIKSNSLFG